MLGMSMLAPSFALLLLSLAVVRGDSAAAMEAHDQSLGLSTVEKTSAGAGFSDSEKAMLVNVHNKLRNKVSPPASNMQPMTWSGELENIAKAFAAECQFGHNKQRSSQSETFNYVGENVYISFGTEGRVAEPEDVVNVWYNEVHDYDYYANSCAYNKMCGHYTQVVWADSYKLGCARQSCPAGWSFVVCNYGPGGNRIGQRPYRT